MATATLTAQAIGAGDPRRARETALIGMRIGALVAAATVLTVWVLRDGIVRLYTRDPAVAALALAPTVIHAAALWGVGVVGGYLVAFGGLWGSRFLPRPPAVPPVYTLGRQWFSRLPWEERMKWLGLALVALLASAHVEAAEIKVLSTVGMQPALPELFAQFEAATGHRVVVTWGLAAVLKTKFQEGAPADVLVLTSPLIDDLAKQGKVVAASKRDVARSGVGVAVKAGAPKPDIGTAEALKAAVLSAKSVGYSREGASGVAFARVLERLGIADQVKAKYKDTGTKAGEMVAAGEIDLAAAQIPELMAVPGVDVVGPLPAELQTVTIFSVGLATGAQEPGAAQALIEFLAGPRATPVYKAKGLGG